MSALGTPTSPKQHCLVPLGTKWHCLDHLAKITSTHQNDVVWLNQTTRHAYQNDVYG